eukprot:GHVR01044974.1.p1 GENE.GHVR01044974.1~~GHVR01044974.1.p1  ORF type:complete len:314 (+),score=42.21 GHVR01044974.1:1242-2183(+)
MSGIVESKMPRWQCHVGKEVTFAKLTINDKGVSLTENKFDDIEQQFNDILNSRQATKSGWASCRGLLTAYMSCLPVEATVVVRDLTWLINKNHHTPWKRVQIKIHPEMIAPIRELLKVLRNDRIRSLDTQTPILIVDSSTDFWGGILHTGAGRHTVNLKGPHTTQTKGRIGQNTLEAEALKKGIEEAHKVLPYKMDKERYSLKVYSDNMAVVSGMNRPENLNHKQRAFFNRIQAALSFCEQNDICLTVSHIPGEENPADELSRPELTATACAKKAKKQEENKEKAKAKNARLQNRNQWNAIEEVDEDEEMLCY